MWTKSETKEIQAPYRVIASSPSFRYKEPKMEEAGKGMLKQKEIGFIIIAGTILNLNLDGTAPSLDNFKNIWTINSPYCRRYFLPPGKECSFLNLRDG